MKREKAQARFGIDRMGNTTVALLVSALYFGVPASVGNAGEERIQNTPAAQNKLFPVRENALPYEGFGSVTIVDDGTLIIEIGGAATTLHDEDDVEFEGIGPYDAIAYQIDMSGLSLVEHRGQVFLDNNGVELRARGLRPREVFRTVFPAPDQIDANRAPTALVWFTGELQLSFDAQTAQLVLRIEDSEETGRVFTLAAPVVSDAKNRRRSEEGGIVLTPLEGHAVGASSCSITCSKGSGSVNCSESGCKCVCKAGKPVCICTNAAS